MQCASVLKNIVSDIKLMQKSTGNLTITDEQLMLKSMEGDKKAFYILVGRWNKPIINFFYKSIGDQETAEDLAQEVFINVWKTKNYNPRAPFYSWLYRIAKNKLIDYYRKKKPVIVSIDDKPEVIDISAPFQLNIVDKLISQEEQKMLKNALNELSEDQKTILILSKYQKLAYEDIAKIMDCSSDTVKVRVFRAVKSFVKKFKELYGNEQ
jgi:RNA polymerase sigma-70 factor (ECF subfamily)